jgi:hypothetical protein
MFKSGDKRNISNYRGISILSAIPKLFEKLVCDVIILIIRPLISDEQHGFVGGCFTVTSLVEFSDFVLSEMKDGLQVDAVYSDFSKAFNRVNHGMLLGTLTRKLRLLVVHSVFGLAIFCLERYTFILVCLRAQCTVKILSFNLKLN